MKKIFFFLAAAAATIGVMSSVSSCKPEDEKTPAPSIQKQWVTTDETADGPIGICFDICVSRADTLLTGFDVYASMLDGAYIHMAGLGYEVTGITATDETSGKVSFIQDAYGDGSTLYEDYIEYSNLTETSVTLKISLTNPVTEEREGDTYECTAAPEGTVVYDLMQAMEILYPTQEE